MKAVFVFRDGDIFAGSFAGSFTIIQNIDFDYSKLGLGIGWQNTSKDLLTVARFFSFHYLTLARRRHKT